MHRLAVAAALVGRAPAHADWIGGGHGDRCEEAFVSEA
jgi:hypothetical protein